MSTIAQMKVVAAPLLARNPDLVFHKRFLFLKPIHHIARFVLLDGTSGEGDFMPRAGCVPLFEKREHIILNHAPRVRRPRAAFLWCVFDQGITDDLIEALETNVLDRLRAIQSTEDFIAFTEIDRSLLKPSIRDFYLRMVTINAASGKFDEALAYCELLASGKARECIPSFANAVALVIDELWPALKTGNPKKVAAVLHGWEEYTVKANKLEKYWEPTPFPIEQM